jgi:hypothetical protein
MGHNWIHYLYSPTEVVGLHGHFEAVRRVGAPRDVAVQVAHLKANFETSFSLHRFKG